MAASPSTVTQQSSRSSQASILFKAAPACRHWKNVSGEVPPNNSFKPNLLRCTNNVAGKACHVVGYATQVGLTQALGPKGSLSNGSGLRQHLVAIRPQLTRLRRASLRPVQRARSQVRWPARLRPSTNTPLVRRLQQQLALASTTRHHQARL